MQQKLEIIEVSDMTKRIGYEKTERLVLPGRGTLHGQLADLQ